MIATLLFPALVVALVVDAYTFPDYARAYFEINKKARS
jgi:hypothetical protein